MDPSRPQCQGVSMPGCLSARLSSLQGLMTGAQSHGASMPVVLQSRLPSNAKCLNLHGCLSAGARLSAEGQDTDGWMEHAPKRGEEPDTGNPAAKHTKRHKPTTTTTSKKTRVLHLGRGAEP
ncbi:hypothetical protein GWK47_035747 [Chionoecetes opilio]|uniref:Uncharacterized protein n=1 Tax=Chionoecetes opilio TaxID=41210 RepID=A0A8J4YGH6_CHIOP|nr:hypothetical protein GWK47_035747 [Chionoecetes opilio]